MKSFTLFNIIFIIVVLLNHSIVVDNKKLVITVDQLPINLFLNYDNIQHDIQELPDQTIYGLDIKGLSEVITLDVGKHSARLKSEMFTTLLNRKSDLHEECFVNYVLWKMINILKTAFIIASNHFRSLLCQCYILRHNINGNVTERISKIIEHYVKVVNFFLRSRNHFLICYAILVCHILGEDQVSLISKNGFYTILYRCSNCLTSVILCVDIAMYWLREILYLPSVGPLASRFCFFFQEFADLDIKKFVWLWKMIENDSLFLRTHFPVIFNNCLFQDYGNFLRQNFGSFYEPLSRDSKVESINESISNDGLYTDLLTRYNIDEEEKIENERSKSVEDIIDFAFGYFLFYRYLIGNFFDFAIQIAMGVNILIYTDQPEADTSELKKQILHVINLMLCNSVAVKFEQKFAQEFADIVACELKDRKFSDFRSTYIYSKFFTFFSTLKYADYISTLDPGNIQKFDISHQNEGVDSVFMNAEQHKHNHGTYIAALKSTLESKLGDIEESNVSFCCFFSCFQSQ